MNTMTEKQLHTKAKKCGLMVRKDGNNGYLLTDMNNCLMAPGPMSVEEAEKWLDDLILDASGNIPTTIKEEK